MPTTDGMMQAFEMLTAMGLRPPGDNPALALRLWLRLFSGVSDGLMAKAIEAHLCDPEQGKWWPKPADITRQLARLQAEHSPYDEFGYRRPPQLEVVGGAHQLEDREARQAEREEQRRQQAEWRAASERRAAAVKAEEARRLAYGEVYGPRLLKLSRRTVAELDALGSCDCPVGEHAAWHRDSGITAADPCPYRVATERARRRGGRLGNDDDITAALDGVVNGGAA